MPNTAVIFFSHSGETYSSTGNLTHYAQGNCERLARYVASKIEAPLFQIIPIKEYSPNYQECLEEAKRDKEQGVFPELLYDMDPIDFKNIVLIYPNWFNSCPMPIFTYLAHHKFEEKRILPICTHGGSGMGHSENELKSAMPGAIFLKGFALPGEEVDEKRDEVVSYIQKSLAK